MTTTCPKCSGTMQNGYATAKGLMAGHSYHPSGFVFAVSEVVTPLNPIKAFKQGLSGDYPQKEFRIEGVRCSTCGFIELYGRQD